MLNKMKHTVARHLTNIPGWRTNRKIVVFESDDWGSIRMPSKQNYKKLLAEGIRVDESIFDTYDTLEQREDLNLLFNVLIKYVDKYESHPIFTFNTVMGNPAFEKIERDNFEKYYWEDFFTSYKVYNKENIADLWYEAINKNLIRPQFHAREHLNVSLWMEALQKDYRETKIAFKHKFFGLKTQTPSAYQNHYLAAYWAENENDCNQKINILENGLDDFRAKFGFDSESFVACNYIYPEVMEKKMSDAGINFIQTQSAHISPDLLTAKKNIRRHFTGQTNKFKQYYLVRNCTFEPVLDQSNDSVNRCLKQIKTAFRWNKPAILSTHRINYVGGLSSENRDDSLDKLNRLISQILKIWPDVEFFSSDKLGQLIESE